MVERDEGERFFRQLFGNSEHLRELVVEVEQVHCHIDAMLDQPAGICAVESGAGGGSEEIGVLEPAVQFFDSLAVDKVVGEHQESLLAVGAA